MQLREGLQAVDNVVIVLTTDGRYGLGVLAFSELTVADDARSQVGPLARSQCTAVSVVRPRTLRCPRQVVGQVAESLWSVYIRWMDALLHQGAVALARGEAGELLEQIEFPLSGQRGNLLWPVSPGVSAVAAGAALQVKDLPVFRIGCKSPGLPQKPGDA